MQIIHSTKDDSKTNDKNNFKIDNNVALEEFNLKANQEKTIFVTQYGKKINTELGTSIYNRISNLIEKINTLNITSKTGKTDNSVGDYLWDNFVQLLKSELSINNIYFKKIF